MPRFDTSFNFGANAPAPKSSSTPKPKASSFSRPKASKSKSRKQYGTLHGS